MAHFAKIENGVVTEVIVAEQDFINTQQGTWVQTSYNTAGGVHYESDGTTASADQTKALRKNYAGIGYSYDSNKDAFIPPKLFNSWILNETSCLWEPPTPKPDDTNVYEWNEETQNWDKIN